MNRSRLGASILAPCLVLIISGGRVAAVTVPFTEDFTTDSANWFDSAGTSAMTWQSTGGPDGGSYASTGFNFAGSAPTDSPAIYRGQSNLGSSGGAFVGDWLGDGVTEFRTFVRHDAGVDLSFFARFASSVNFPAVVALAGGPVPSGVWTELIIPIAPGPAFIAEGPSTFSGVFGNLGNIQLGVFAAPLAATDQPVMFDLDKVTIVPEPASLALLGLGSLALGRVFRSRRRRT